MDEQLKDGPSANADADHKPPIDPLRRVFRPIEVKTAKGTTVFRTRDNCLYARLDDGSIRRVTPKVRGKAARRADKVARRTGA